MLCAGVARAQVSDADLVTRIGRLEATIRELTGRVEQLQYRNQQLEQQVQRLQEEACTWRRGEGPGTSAGRRPVPRPTATIPASLHIHRNPRGTAGRDVAGGAAAGDRDAAGTRRPRPRRRFRSRRQSERAGRAAPARHQHGCERAAAAGVGRSGPGPRQIGAPLDLSTPSPRPPGDLPPPPPSNPSGDRRHAGDAAADATRRRTNTISLTAMCCTRTMRSRPKPSAASCANIRAIAWRRRRNTGWAKACSSSSNIATPPKSFLAVSTKYETTARAPEALLRLGQSLAALGEKEAACASLGEVLRKYPRASSSVKQAVDREQKRGHC